MNLKIRLQYSKVPGQRGNNRCIAAVSTANGKIEGFGFALDKRKARDRALADLFRMLAFSWGR